MVSVDEERLMLDILLFFFSFVDPGSEFDTASDIDSA
jgi:hypothetical protein